MSDCPLCTTKGEQFYKDEFFICPTCEAIFKNPEFLLGETQEKERYQLHSDNADDIGYQQFVSPIVKSVLKDFKIDAIGLDFGTGQSQIVAKLLHDEGYDVNVYDPYFAPYSENLDKKYDFITACEVIEHFNHPQKEFALLYSLLKENGKLYCMTHLYDESINFAKWYYKNDTTHIFVYQKSTMEFIQREFGFKDMTIDKRLVVFTK